jgi:hypothetical protein
MRWLSGRYVRQAHHFADQVMNQSTITWASCDVRITPGDQLLKHAIVASLMK